MSAILGDVAKLQPGFAFKSSTFCKTGVRLLRGTNIEPGRTRWIDVVHLDPADAKSFEAYALNPGDVVIAMDRPIVSAGLKVVVLQESDLPALLLQRVGRFSLGPRLDPKFLYAYLNGPLFTSHVSGQATGTQLPHISATDVETAPLPLPPLNEQRRIVAKLETLQDRSRRAREALDSVPPLLEKLRQSILASAFRGDLTKDWRAKHPNVEPADKLLQRIRTERRTKWEQAELAKLIAKGKPPKDDRWKDRYEEPKPVDTSGLPELPKGWCWASVAELTQFVTDGEHATPPRTQQGVLLLSARNVLDGALRLENVDYISQETHERLSRRLRVQAFDVLLTCSGSVGRSCVVPDDLEFSLVRSVAVLRPTKATDVTANWMSFALRSPVVRELVEERKTETAQANLFQGKILMLPVPLAPDIEQSAVVQAICSALESLLDGSRGVEVAETALDVLDRAILAKAFRGELVPQDPNDEPVTLQEAPASNATEDGPTPRAKRSRATARPKRAANRVKG